MADLNQPARPQNERQAWVVRCKVVTQYSDLRWYSGMASKVKQHWHWCVRLWGWNRHFGGNQVSSGLYHFSFQSSTWDKRNELVLHSRWNWRGCWLCRKYLFVDKMPHWKVWYKLHVSPDSSKWKNVLLLCHLIFSFPFFQWLCWEHILNTEDNQDRQAYSAQQFYPRWSTWCKCWRTRNQRFLTWQSNWCLVVRLCYYKKSESEGKKNI